MKNFRKNKGQELVEFALILPIMLVILVAIAEMGFMWTLRGTVSDAVKSSVQQMQTIAGTDKTTAEATLQANIRNYLANHGVPNANSLTVTLSDPNASENTVVNVSYSYNPTFTLPNFFGIQLLPDTITMGSSQVINSAILRANNYASGDPVLPSLINPNSPTSILLGDPTGEERKRMAFIVNLPGDVDKLVNWWGHDLMPAGAGINAEKGVIMVRTPYNSDYYGGALANTPNARGWVETNDSYASLLLANGYTNVVYVDGSGGMNIDGTRLPGPVEAGSGDLGAAISWCVPSSLGGATCNGDLTTNGANSSLLVQSIYEIGKGYEVLPPAPSASPIDAVTLPSGDLVSDKVFREMLYKDENFAKLQFYYPKSAGSDFTPPGTSNALDLTTAAGRTKALEQTIDGDGDGIPSYWDKNLTDADDDKNLQLDGYQNPSGFTVKAAYDVYDWGPISGHTGNVPTSNVALPGGLTAKTMVTEVKNNPTSNNLYLTPGAPNNTKYATNACAVSGGCNTQPYFLKINSNYTTDSGETIRPIMSAGRCAGDAQYSSYCASEKMRPPDSNKAVFIVDVISRDHDHDGVFEPSTGLVAPVDDDGNDDGINNNDPADIAYLSNGSNFTRGLLFVDTSTGGSVFSDTVANPNTMGYSAVNPSSISVTSNSYMTPDRKATAN